MSTQPSAAAVEAAYVAWRFNKKRGFAERSPMDLARQIDEGAHLPELIAALEEYDKATLAHDFPRLKACRLRAADVLAKVRGSA